MTEHTGVAAVDRALMILDSFRDSDGVLSLAALSAKTGLYKSTILRLLSSLEAFGYVRRLETGGYRIGPKVSELAAIYQTSFKLGDFVLPVLTEIVKDVNESASFYVREGKNRLCLFRVEADQIIRDHIRVGDILPLNRGASGRVLQHFAKGLQDDARAKDMIETSFGERHPDMAAIASPVFGVGEQLVGALSVSGPRSRFNATATKRIAKTVARAAAELSISLGASPSRMGQLSA